MGRPLRGTTRYAVLVPQAAIHGTRRHYPWSHLGTTPPVSWSYRGHFRGTNRGARTKAVVPAWSLVSHGKSGLWDHSTVGPRMVPAPRRGGPAPRAATGHRGRARARGLTAIVDGDGSEAARRPPGPPLGLSGRVPRVRPTCRRAPRRPATRVARRHGPPPHLCEIANPSFRRPCRARGVRPGGTHGPCARPRPPLPLPARTCPRRPLSPPWSGCGARSTPRASSSGQARGMHWATFRRVGVRLRRRGGIHPPRRDGGMTYARGRGHDVC